MLSHIIGPVNEDWLTSSENKIEQRSETHLIIKEGFPKKAVGRSDIVKRFPASERTGFDFAVLQEGEIGVGESIELVQKTNPVSGLAILPALYAREAQHRVAPLGN